MRRVMMILLVALAGCGGMAGKDAAPRAMDCPTNASTVALAVSPDPVARGDAIDIEVTWTVTAELTPPVQAFLNIGDAPAVEVELPLVSGSSDYPYTWVGLVLNPFGAAAPAGTVGVLTSASIPAGCELAPTAATGFTLE